AFGRHVGQLSEQLWVVRLVVAVHAGVSRAVDAWRAADRFAAQARIIGDGGQAARFAEGFGLDAGVFGKGRAGFLGVKVDAELPQTLDGVAGFFKQPAQFAQLADVVGGSTDDHASPSFSFARSGSSGSSASEKSVAEKKIRSSS